MPDLTKWPRLLVTGTPVTEEQANEILVRTANLWLLPGNDRDWTATVEPGARICEPTELDESDVLGRFLPLAERGVTEERLTVAVAQVLASVSQSG